MTGPLTLFTGQWADLPFEALCARAGDFGYDGLEIAAWGDHFDVARALEEEDYVEGRWEILERHGLRCWALSNHLVGQAVCDRIDERHRGILPARVWGDGEAEGVRERAAAEMKDTARAARRFFDAGPADWKPAGRAPIVTGFTGSPIWHLCYSFPPVPEEWITEGYADFARRWLPILEVFDEVGIDFALEVHPTEIVFDTASARLAVEAVGGHDRFGFNLDPSHFAYQGADYLGFLRAFPGRIRHVHVKDVWWSETPAEAGVFGGHTAFHAPGRYWDFRSPGRGRVDFEAIFRELLRLGYEGPLSVEWEDGMMDREHGAREAAAFVRSLVFPPSPRAFDEAFGGRGCEEGAGPG